LQSSVDNLHPYVEAPHYLGLAGIRARLIDNVVDGCAQYQAQAAPGPVPPSGTYPPALVNKEICPGGYDLIPSSATIPSSCIEYQPDVSAIASVTYTCPKGGTVNSSHICELQLASYSAIASKLYTCPTGDTVKSGVCPFGGVKKGEGCLYPPYSANIVSQTCPSGFNLVGNLCYNDATLAATIKTANGTSVIDSTKTYGCNGSDTLNGAFCEIVLPSQGAPYAATVITPACPTGYTFTAGSIVGTDPTTGANIYGPSTCVNDTTSAVISPVPIIYSCPNNTDVLIGSTCNPPQPVQCVNQPPSVASIPVNHYNCPTTNKTGNYFIGYTMVDNTVQLNSCTALPITKSASVQGSWCDAPYVFNGATNKCEYQMPDYTASYCADATYTFNASSGLCEKIPPTYPAF
jgi:hypothetical protein